MRVGDMQESCQALPRDWGAQAAGVVGTTREGRVGLSVQCPPSQGPGPFFPILEPVLPLPNPSSSCIPTLEVRSKGLQLENSLYC